MALDDEELGVELPMKDFMKRFDCSLLRKRK
jgi:hypothetical protein